MTIKSSLIINSLYILYKCNNEVMIKNEPLEGIGFREVIYCHRVVDGNIKLPLLQ